MPEIYRNGLNYGAALPNGGQTGQVLVKRSNGNGDVTWDDAGGAIFCYVVGNVPYAANWLSKTPNGTPLTPNEKLIYLIISAGEYYHNFVRWDATNTVYLPIASGGTGGGAIYAYVDATKTALDDDWLLDGNGDTITPEEGLLYLILSSGEFFNSIYRFDETLNEYILVSRPQQFSAMPTASAFYSGAIVQYIGSTTVNYIHNYFYECIEESGVYSWVNVKVQPGDEFQFTTMPTASADYLGKVFQYVGVTTNDFTHNYFYECIFDDPDYEWIVTRVEKEETREITQAEFENLSQEEKDNGQAYFINDAELEDSYLAHVGFTPVGTIISVLGSTAPNHYLKCNGATYLIHKYKELADYFEIQFGSKNYFGGNGTTTFAVPDYVGGNSDAIYCIACHNIFIDTELRLSLNEMVIGLWEDGSPLYEITLEGTTINTTAGSIATGLTGIDYAELERFQVNNGTYVKNLLDSVAINKNGSEIIMAVAEGSLYMNKPFSATIHYKKSIPTP